MRHAQLPRLVVTPGEPAGIGPDILIAAAQQDTGASLTAVADPELLKARAAQLGLPLQIECVSEIDAVTSHRGASLQVLPMPLASEVRCGALNTANSPYVLQCIERAASLCLDGRADALVTGPVHKGVINDAGIAFTGHTEYLAERCGCTQVVMLLVAPGIRVALLTTHVPLAEVPRLLTPERLEHVIRVLSEGLRIHFGVECARIAVCGLNPHAGEGGHLGREEMAVMDPVLVRLRTEGLNLSGPLPADTVFTTANLSRFDAVLTMYHDQGLPVVKHLGFGNAVNVSLGLPIIRTSVDHGTALTLAGSGRADCGSLRAAIDTAIEMATRRHRADARGSSPALAHG